MKKIITASLVAMMAVTAAHADIASTTYVDSRTGDVENSTFVKTLETGKKNLSGAVDALAGKLSSGNLTIANGAVGTNQLADGAVTSGKIADGTIVDADISADANIAQTKIAGLGDALNAKQDVANITQDIDADNDSTVKYPSAKAVVDFVDDQIADITGDVGTQLDSLTTLINDNKTAINNNKTAADTGIQEAKNAAASAKTYAEEKASAAQTAAEATAKAYTDEKNDAMDQRVTDIEGSDYAKSGITLTKVNAYDAHVANEDIHVTTTDKSRWDAKQDKLTASNVTTEGTTGVVKAVVGGDGKLSVTKSAVATDDIAASAVTTEKIANTAVTTAKIADLNVTTAKIANTAVTTEKIAANAVTTAKIADGNVTSDKLASDVQTSLDNADSAVQRTQVGMESGFEIDAKCKAQGVVCSLVVRGDGTNAIASWEVVAK